MITRRPAHDSQMPTSKRPAESAAPRYMPSELKTRAIEPSRAMAIKPPSPGSSSGRSLVQVVSTHVVLLLG